MSKCIRCGTNFVGTPENPSPPGLCRYCERDDLRNAVKILRAALIGLVGVDASNDLDRMERSLRANAHNAPNADALKVALDGIEAIRATQNVL